MPTAEWVGSLGRRSMRPPSWWIGFILSRITTSPPKIPFPIPSSPPPPRYTHPTSHRPLRRYPRRRKRPHFFESLLPWPRLDTMMFPPCTRILPCWIFVILTVRNHCYQRTILVSTGHNCTTLTSSSSISSTSTSTSNSLTLTLLLPLLLLLLLLLLRRRRGL